MFHLRPAAGPLAVIAIFILAQPSAGGIGIGPPSPSAVAMTADVVVLGKVVDFERDEVEALPEGSAPGTKKVRYRIADLTIEDPLIGAKGFTRLRVGQAPPPAPVGKAAPRRPVPFSLQAGQEGVFFLTRHPKADFYVLQSGFGVVPLLKSNPNFDRELAQVKLVAKTVDDPVGTLKSKTVEDRFIAALTLLTRYSRYIPAPSSGDPRTEDIPAEENKLILSIMLELPWSPKGLGPQMANSMVPCRSAMWLLVRAERYGFKAPELPRARPGQPVPDYNKMMEEATTAFLKENMDRIKLQKVVLPK